MDRERDDSIDGQRDGWMDELMNGWMGGWIDGCVGEWHGMGNWYIRRQREGQQEPEINQQTDWYTNQPNG